MIPPLLAQCAAHAPAEVEYLCSSFLWSVFWFLVGWVFALCTVILTGGDKK